MIDRETSIPSKKGNYSFAESVFYSQFNDINFYVEDADQEELYFLIFKRLFPDISIDKIFPLGGKKNVIEHCQKHIGHKKHVYIVDKDFDDLLGKIFNYDNLFYLNLFCIENYFFEEDAFINYVVSDQPKLKKAAIRASLDFNNTLLNVLHQLRYLFNLFFIAQKLNVEGISNTKIMPEEFCFKRDKTEIDVFTVCKYKHDLHNAVTAQNILSDINAEYRNADLVLFFDTEPIKMHKNVSGKHVIHMFFHILKKKYKIASTSIDSFCYRLAEHCNFHTLADLSKEVTDFIKADGDVGNVWKA